jgi:hypothetical protein
MRAKNITLGTLAAIGGLLHTACSNEPDMIFDEPDDNAIRFAATTEYSRTGDITTNNLTSFNVYAYTGLGTNPNLFMNNVTVTKTDINTWTYSPVEYWPAKEEVDFYAFSPATWVGPDGPLKPVAYDSYPGNEDIVYAVSPNLSGYVGMANAQVLFNFRHALAKITVKMSSTNTDIQVKVSNVVIANIMTKGSFLFPTASTAEKPTEYTLGRWTGQNTPVTYVVHMSQTADDIITLTSTPTDMIDSEFGMGGAKYVTPQTLSWRSNGNGSDTYIAIMCSIYDTQTGTKLWPNANTPAENVVEGSTYGDGLMKFPLSSSLFSEWYPGYHYIYNITINSNEDMGAIEFGTPQVDSFVDINTNYQ